MRLGVNFDLFCLFIYCGGCCVYVVGVYTVELVFSDFCWVFVGLLV